MILGKRIGKTIGPRRILVVDPSLKRRAGHPYHASQSVEKAAAAAGFDTIVFAAKRIEIATKFNRRLKKCFSRNLYIRDDWSFAGYEKEAALLGSEIAHALGGDGPSMNAVVIPTCDQTQLRAIGDLIEQGRLPRSLAILGWLLFPPRWDADPTAAGAEAQLGEYQDAIGRIAAARDRRGPYGFVARHKEYKTATGRSPV